MSNTMDLFCLTTLDELAPYADGWDQLARGVPFRGWNWLSCWWRHYGGGRRGLRVLCAFERGDALAGVAPWFLETSPAQGRVLRFLGSGEVCSDHLTVLCEPGREGAVTEAMADWLSRRSGAAGQGPGPAQETDETWDLLELTGVDAGDAAVDGLCRRLASHGHAVHRRPGPDCWRIELPETWEAFLDQLSSSHRSQVRRADRQFFGPGRAVLRTVDKIEQLPRGMEILIGLHRARRRALGQPDCFVSAQFEAMHRELAPRLLAAGQLQLHWIEVDGAPVAAEYHLAGADTVYAYQSGIGPTQDCPSPGRLAHLATVRRAIAEGRRGFDFLRGDEAYKSHWRAVPHGTEEIRIVPPVLSARLRHGVHAAGMNVKEWLRSGLRLVGAREK